MTNGAHSNYYNKPAGTLRTGHQQGFADRLLQAARSPSPYKALEAIVQADNASPHTKYKFTFRDPAVAEVPSRVPLPEGAVRLVYIESTFMGTRSSNYLVFRVDADTDVVSWRDDA